MTKALKLNPVATWSITPKDSSISGKIILAIKAKATTTDKLVEYFAESGLAPKSKEWQDHPASYLKGYLSFLKKQNVIA